MSAIYLSDYVIVYQKYILVNKARILNILSVQFAILRKNNYNLATKKCGVGLVVEHVLAKDETGVRFPYPAQSKGASQLLG